MTTSPSHLPDPPRDTPLDVLTRVAAFDAVVTSLGAKLAWASGRPIVTLDPPDAGYRAARSHAAWMPLPDREALTIAGPDRATFLQGLVTNDVRLQVGAGCHAGMLDVKGRLQHELRITARTDDFLVEVDVAGAAVLAATLDRYLFRDKVQLHDQTGALGALLLMGPATGQVLEGLGLGPLVPVSHGHTTTGFAGVPVSVVGASWGGALPAVTLWVLVDDLTTVAAQLHEAVQGAGGQLMGWDTLEATRVEAGIPRFGVDLDSETIPLDALVPDMLDFHKGCYLGQEVIARVEARGAANRCLFAVELGRAVPPSTALFATADAGRKEQGHVTSVAASGSSGHVLGLAWIKRAYAKAGNKLTTADGVTVELLDEGRGRP